MKFYFNLIIGIFLDLCCALFFMRFRFPVSVKSLSGQWIIVISAFHISENIMLLGRHMFVILALVALTIAGVVYWAGIVIAIISSGINQENYVVPAKDEADIRAQMLYNESLTKGMELNQLTNYNKSLGYFDKALSIYPNSSIALYQKGFALFKLAEYNQSIIYFDRTLSVDPTHFFAMYNKGIALSSIGKYQETIQVLDEAISLNPGHKGALESRRLVLNALDRYAQ